MNDMNDLISRVQTGAPRPGKVLVGPCFVFFGFGLIIMGIFSTAISSHYDKFDRVNTPRIMGICSLSIGGIFFVMGVMWLVYVTRKHKEMDRTTNNANATMCVYTMPPVTAGVGQSPIGQYLPGQYASGQQPVGQQAPARYVPGPGPCPPGQQAFILQRPMPYSSQPYSSHEPYSTNYPSTSGQTVTYLPKNETTESLSISQKFDAPPPSYETVKKSRLNGGVPV